MNVARDFHHFEPWVVPAGYIAFHDYEQLLRSSRQNLSPVKRIDRSLLMRHEHTARALVKLMEIGKTASGTDPVLQHAPEAFNRIEVVTAPGR